MNLEKLLKDIRKGSISVEDGLNLIENSSYININETKIDNERTKRRGFPETIYCEYKTSDQLFEIYDYYSSKKKNILGTRCSKDQYLSIKDKIPELIYDDVSRVLKLEYEKTPTYGNIAICTAGASDIYIGEEAALVCEYFGANVNRYYDIGIAGIHRLLSNISEIKKANAIIAIAGMDGALPGVIAGLVDIPVIAVPTSVGYGASFEGVSALLTMLNSCAEGVSVVNIDNGFGAAYCACQINRRICENE